MDKSTGLQVITTPSVQIRILTDHGSLKGYVDGCRGVDSLGGLVPVFRLGVPLRCRASKLEYPLRIPPLEKSIFCPILSLVTLKSMYLLNEVK